MNSTKDKKKTQKLNKKQQQLQKQQQQQQQQNEQQQQHSNNNQIEMKRQQHNNKNGSNHQQPQINGKNTQKYKNTSTGGSSSSGGGNSPNSSIQSAAIVSDAQKKSKNHNNNNNNNSITINNNNLNLKLDEYYKRQNQNQEKAQLIGYENAPKFERSNSFSLKGSFYKIINKITSSKENLTKIDHDQVQSPYNFTRAKSMILPRRANRLSLIEPQLEQLSEEAEKSNELHSPSSPRKNSVDEADESNVPVLRNKELHTPRRPASHIITSTPIDEPPLQRRGSSISLAIGSSSSGFNPQMNFQKKRSNTFISSFKSTIAGISSVSEKKAQKLNPKWSASLQSLQAIDNMVKYDDMKFIDYDKLNAYEKLYEQRQSNLSLLDPALAATNNDTSVSGISLPMTPTQIDNESMPPPLTPSPSQLMSTVVRRQKTNSSKASRNSLRNSYNMDTDYEHNLDKHRNVYRESLDSRKLEHLNDISRNSFISDMNLVDILDLENGSVRKRDQYIRNRRSGSWSATNVADVVDGTPTRKLKSKSLTHLDGWDTKTTPGSSSNASAAAKVPTVSSTEYFSITFPNEHGHADNEVIALSKGATLSTALNQALKKRNLSFSQIIITDNNATPGHLDTHNRPVALSLDENTETERLAGHHLIITERDGSRKTLQKAASFGARARPPGLLSSASTEDNNEGLSSGKQIKQRFSGFFGVKNPQQSQLCELLNTYAVNGVPQKETCLSFEHPDLDSSIAYLDRVHSSWRDFVDVSRVKEEDNCLQNAIWELVSTEVCYIQSLKTVTDLFLACLEAIQEEHILTEIDSNKLFSNIRLIYEANLKFFTIYLYPMLSHSFLTNNPLNWFFFRQGFISFPSIFAPYTKYCAEQSTCQFYCKELYRSNILFKSYLTWCESQKMCNRLTLVDILVTPMQRLTKYSLLLGAIKKHMTNSEDIDALDKMASLIQSVEAFVLSVNNHLTARQENERLKGVMARIESYDVVETNNDNLERLIKKHSAMFDLCGPMLGCTPQTERHLYMEGDLKFKDNAGKAEVHCFLLTDMLLVCKPIAKKGLGSLKVIRQPYITDRLIVEQNNNVLYCVYLNEFEVCITAFTLQSAEVTKWFEAIKRAKTFYAKLKASASSWENSRLAGSAASGGTVESLSGKLNSRVSTANNSHSGSVEWTESRHISADFEKTNSMSSEEGGAGLLALGYPLKGKHLLQISPQRTMLAPTTSSNTLSVQPGNGLGQSLPNLTVTQSHSVPLRRGMAFSTSTKNPPLLKTRNITSQSSIICHQTPAGHSHQHSPSVDIIRINPTPTGSQGSFSSFQPTNEMGSAQLLIVDKNSSIGHINELQDQKIMYKLSNSSLASADSIHLPGSASPSIGYPTGSTTPIVTATAITTATTTGTVTSASVATTSQETFV